jgi:hypothetical protein
MQITRSPDVLPDGMGFVYLCSEVPFMTSDDVTQALHDLETYVNSSSSSCDDVSEDI